MIKKVFRMMALFAVIFSFAYAAVGSGTPSQHMARVALGGTTLALVPTTGNMLWMYTAFKTIYDEAYNKQIPDYDKIALIVPSSAKRESYEWLGAFPKMRQWIGSRHVMALKEKGYIIANLRHEVTVGIPRKDIELDTYGLYRPVIAGMGASARLHPDELVFPLLTNGFTSNAYDNLPFFSASHQCGTNLGTATLTLRDGSPNVEAYKTARAAIGRIKDDQGKPLFTSAAKKLILVVPPELEEVASHILHDDFISVSGGSTQNNVWKNSADLLCSPQLSNPTAWFLLVEFMGLRPIIFQQQQAPLFVVKNVSQESDHVFMEDEFLYGADSFDNAGYSLPQLAYGSSGTVTPEHGH